jgi:outer membrane receptor protein involved in Fe transport
MSKRVHNAILGTAFAAVTGATAAQVPTTIEYIGEATVFVSGTPPSAAPGVGRENPMGHEVVAGASRTIDLTGRRKAVNVTAGEIVEFRLDGHAVTWDFDTLGTPSFVLSRIIPGAPAVRVYVAPDPMNGGS